MLIKLYSITGAIGRRTIGLASYSVDLATFLVHAVHDLLHHGPRFNRAALGSLVSQIIFTGVDALPSITLIGAAVGVGMVSHLISLMGVFGSTSDMVSVLSEVVALEMAPLLTAIVIIGRSASAIAVDLGNMKLHKEVEWLWFLGVNTNDFLVTPRLLGAVISQIALAVYFTVIAIVTGALFASSIVATGYIKFLREIPMAYEPLDLLLFLAKNTLFGLIAATAACYHGLQVERSRTELPQQTQRAIVNAISFVFVIDGLMALMQA
jgi:phospholipid/cholesterol/gamma-HCH transport system permease protein